MTRRVLWWLALLGWLATWGETPGPSGRCAKVIENCSSAWNRGECVKGGGCRPKVGG